MAGPFEANVFETTETQGTGAKTLAGAVTGAITFRTAFGDGPIVVGYVMRNAVEDGTFEEGWGTFAHSTNSTLTPLAVTSSSNSDAAVDWGSRTKNIWCAIPAKVANGFMNLNAGDSEPSETFAGMPWHDTTNDLLKVRNQDDDAWITIGVFDEATGTFRPADNSVTLASMEHGTQGDILYYGASGAPARLSAGTAGQVLQTQGAGANPQWADAGLPRSHLAGLGLSNNSTNSDHIDVAAGECRDTADAADIVLSAITKRCNETWAAGTDAGGLSSSLTALAANTWYHVFAIIVGGEADVGFDTDVDAANLISDHSATAYRRIGSFLTNGSANVIAFHQRGDEFLWDSVVQDINDVSALTSSARLLTLSVPEGIQVEAIISGNVFDASATTVLFTSPDQADVAPTTNGRADVTANAGAYGAFQKRLRTNTSSQIRGRSSVANTDLYLTTHGWIDTRGRDD